ncbi:MAG: GxxExxY protein [Woronichinia naegeliana WA131]|uniref:GxxExxY protein n=1 Tax=Woronichinia naegeliana WA131 TaxID=2824559 RepID=A0A977PUY9_9CYAN|nr:MAG: GxxExxY protein [Woronichinia naegeliana WA131]
MLNWPKQPSFPPYLNIEARPHTNEQPETSRHHPKIIGASFEVHKFLGNGFQKVIYQRALQYEMHQAGLTFQRQIGQSIYYKDLPEPIGDRTTHLLQRLTRTHWRSGDWEHLTFAISRNT